jgi:two-component system, NtrC family, response regulator HydG
VNSLADYVNRLLRPSKILLVEDDEAVCVVIESLAKKFNCELTVVNTTMDALKAIADETKFDLVLLDYQLPDGNGVEVFKTIRSKYSDMPVCIVTGYLSEHLIEQVRDVGFAVFVQKPKDLTMKNLVNIFMTFGIKPNPECP